jgi:radical SAM superfamily enzyme YgiQ (UPF0313 family)
VDPPISQGLVAAALRKQGCEAEVLDLTWAGDSGLDRLEAMLREPKLSAVGMSTYQSNIERCLMLARLVRASRPDVHILFGGPQATHMPPAGLAAMPDVDALCRGSAELVLAPYVNALPRGEFDGCGFLLRRGQSLVDGGHPPHPGPDDIASPFEGELWPLDRYPLGVTFSSRGCPYNCAFCYTPGSTGRRMTYLPVARVLRDVVLMARAGVQHILFADPMFVVDRERTLQLLGALSGLDSGVTFSCEARIEYIDAELLTAMSRVRFIKISFGLESANAEVLRGVRKPMDLECFRDVVLQTLSHGIAVETFYMYGLPGETYDDVLRTFDFVASLHDVVDNISEPQQVQLYFGTDLLSSHRAFGIKLLGERPAYLSPARQYRTATLGPDEFGALEQEWQRRHAAKAKPVRETEATFCPR